MHWESQGRAGAGALRREHIAGCVQTQIDGVLSWREHGRINPAARTSSRAPVLVPGCLLLTCLQQKALEILQPQPVFFCLALLDASRIDETDLECKTDNTGDASLLKPKQLRRAELRSAQRNPAGFASTSYLHAERQNPATDMYDVMQFW